MTGASEQTAIVRTDRGLTISGTSTTLYDLINYLQYGYSIEFIRSTFNLTEVQMTAALTYLRVHCKDVEAEYCSILKEIAARYRDRDEQKREFLLGLVRASPFANPEKNRANIQALRIKRDRKRKTKKLHESIEIVRTERGLTLSGTQILLCDLIGYIRDRYPLALIREIFQLNEAQMNAVLFYIKINRQEVEKEYQLFLQAAENKCRSQSERKPENRSCLEEEFPGDCQLIRVNSPLTSKQ